jgi:tRNA(Ile)-lysidine synthase
MVLEGFTARFLSRFGDVADSRVLVALSGGADSVALLHLLQQPELRLRLEAAHVHHGIRGAEADADADFCRRLVTGLGLPFHLLRLTSPAPAADGREASWRRRRYALLRRLAADRGVSVIATAHHRDDVAEGVLMQLLRGGGPRALSGIRDRTDDGLIRPLLPYSRDEIRRYLTAAGLPWREDRSNTDPAHLRNRVRHHILPGLERTSPGLRTHLVSLARALAESEAFLDDEVQRRCRFIDPWSPTGGVPAAEVARLPPALRVRWLHRQAALAGISRVSRAQVTTFHRLLDGAQPRSVNLARRWRLRVARHRLWLEPPVTPGPYSIPVEQGSVALPIPTWSLRRRPPGPADRDVVWSCRCPPGQITVRSPRADDVLDGTVQLRPLLRELLPRHLRSAWPVLCVDATITWVPGVWECITSGQPGSVLVEVIRS